MPTLDLPTDSPRPPRQTSRGAVHEFPLPVILREKLLALSQREGVTLFMLLLAAFQVLLARYSGQRDIAMVHGVGAIFEARASQWTARSDASR